MLERQRTPVRIEIENTRIRFNTIISIKRGMVVIAKPGGVSQELKTGGSVRMKIPEADAREIRLEIITPNFNLTNGASVFLCKIPTQFAGGARRSTERYDTSRFNNLKLGLGKVEQQFKLVDISLGGCRVKTGSGVAKKLFPIGKEILSASILLGANVSVALSTIVPRMHSDSGVGLQYQVSPDGNHMKYLQHLLLSLAKTEDERMKSASAN
jgi:hypothetical protein